MASSTASIIWKSFSADEKTLAVHFLVQPYPGQRMPYPPSPAPALTVANVTIEGGVRITGINVTSAVSAANVLTVHVDASGDYSTYTLRSDFSRQSANPAPPPGFDPQLSSVDFSFKVECPSDFDCAFWLPLVRRLACRLTAEIDYLAKDYESFPPACARSPRAHHAPRGAKLTQRISASLWSSCSPTRAIS